MQDDWIVLRQQYPSYGEENTGKELTCKKEYVVMAHFVDGKVEELFVEDESFNSRLGNIYIGKVSKVVKNIEAAFLEIADKQMCYFSIKENDNPVFVNEKKNLRLVAGDELIVQLTKEAVKTKEAVVSSNLNFTGRYVVLVHGKREVRISSKIHHEHKARLKELISPLCSDSFGFIVRTNAQNAQEGEILAEAKALIDEYEHLLDIGKHRSVFSCLKANLPMFIKKLKDIRFSEETRVLTDDENIFHQMEAYLKEAMPGESFRLFQYEDRLLSMSKLYSIEKVIEDALKMRVWLKSGGYLIIQVTEALTVIDVNSGKFDGKKKKEETFLKINREAATEIARQLRLRNLSGMILVDFINLEMKENNENLLSFFREQLKKDSVKTTLVDMTGLGLVELTRKKMDSPLYEKLGRPCPVCHGNSYIYDVKWKEDD